MQPGGGLVDRTEDAALSIFLPSLPSLLTAAISPAALTFFNASPSRLRKLAANSFDALSSLGVMFAFSFLSIVRSERLSPFQIVVLERGRHPIDFGGTRADRCGDLSPSRHGRTDISNDRPGRL